MQRIRILDIKSEIDNIREFVEKGNYHAAMNLSISAMNECRRNNDQAGVDTFLEVIRGIVDTMSVEFGS
jgi:hypothetical protein